MTSTVDIMDDLKGRHLPKAKVIFYEQTMIVMDPILDFLWF